jgi:hypothetical protein
VGFNAGVYPNRSVCSIGKSFQSTAFGIEMPHRSKQCSILTGPQPFGLCFGNTYHHQRIGFHRRDAMSIMKDREEGFERKFAIDEELRFKASARRNRALGLWAAEKLGKTGVDAQAYANEVVVSDIEEAGDHDVFRKIRKDFDAAGVDQSDHQIRRTMDELMAQATEQLKNT